MAGKVTGPINPTRRQAIATLALAVTARSEPPAVDPSILERCEQAVETYMKRQITNPLDRRCGTFADDNGLFWDTTAAGIIDMLSSAFLYPASKFHKNNSVFERIRLAAEYLQRAQSPEGFVTLPISNFNSPPDTAFVTQPVASAAHNARQFGVTEIARMLEPFLKKAALGLTRGGIHTPNHRWVVSAALAQLNELYPDPALVRRVDQWLAEGIDIDSDGQYTERSTLVYNPIVDRSLIIIAAKLRRPELLDPVRRNLDSMLYLLHPNYEVVTEISTRQDLNQRGTMAPYWFALAYLAARDGNGRYATLARHFASGTASLSALLEYPELSRVGPAPTALPDDYEKRFPLIGVTRVRRGLTSATLLDHNSRFFSLRRGDAVLSAVRFASAFFGKGQFVPDNFAKRGASYVLTQSLAAPYWQPLDPPRRVAVGEWSKTRPLRRETEVCRMEQSATITETRGGFRVRIQAAGTHDVPVTIELTFREGGRFEGCKESSALPSGFGVYRLGANGIRFGPGMAAHRYYQVRGAEPKLAGPSVYVTGFTPFDHTIEIDLMA